PGSALPILHAILRGRLSRPGRASGDDDRRLKLGPTAVDIRSPEGEAVDARQVWSEVERPRIDVADRHVLRPVDLRPHIGDGSEVGVGHGRRYDSLSANLSRPLGGK